MGHIHKKFTEMHIVYCQHITLLTASLERYSYGMKTVLLPTAGSLWEAFGNFISHTNTTGTFTTKLYINTPHKGF